MKNAIYYLILTIFLFFSCAEKTDFEDSPSIIGNWIWVESSGGIAGQTHTPESTGNQVVLKISDESIKKFENGELISERTYEIEYGESIRTTDMVQLIDYENGFKQSFERNENILYLFDECYDCFQSEYVKE